MSKLPQFFLSYPLVPGENAVDGIKFDFCDGVRILFPKGGGEHRVVLSDIDSGIAIENVVCCDGAKFRSEIRYYVNWRIDIFQDSKLIFEHSIDMEGKEVLFIMNTDAIGDTVAWFPYVDKFQRLHKCKAGIIMSKKLRPLFEPNYPNVAFFDRGAEKLLSPYASFSLGINYECNVKMNKRAFNSVGLQQLIGYDLGFDNDLDVKKPEILTYGKRLVDEPYVLMSVVGSCKCKDWHNLSAIVDVVSYLKSLGYRVLVIDKEDHGNYGGAENWTGDRPLLERTTLMRDADLFIGVSSGLSWLAWACCKCPIVLVSGFTEPWVEFHTPYRVQNANVCHGCWNDLKRCYCDGDGKDGCPSNKDFECSRKITAQLALAQVKRALEEAK